MAVREAAHPRRQGAAGVTLLLVIATTAAVTVDDLRAVFASMPERTADKVPRCTGTVFDWVVAGGHRPDNPAAALRRTWRGLGENGAKGHYKALPFAAAPALYAQLRAQGAGGAAGAMALLLLTALWNGEARGGRRWTWTPACGPCPPDG